MLSVGWILTFRVTGEKLIQIGNGLFATSKDSVLEMVRKVDQANAVLFNLPQYAEVMFYSETVAYPFLPSSLQVSGLVEKGKNIYVVQDKKNNFEEWYNKLDSRLKEKVHWLEPIPEKERLGFWMKIRTLL